MKLIVAQGNPGPEYAATRHNVGFIVLEAYARKHSATFQAKDKFKAELAEFSEDSEKALLAKPQTFYNLTGESVRALVDFYKLNPEQDVLIIHDELALPFGTIRTRHSGSDAGNNGIKSINQHVGSDTSRIRIGIANELRERMDDASFVLSKFNTDENKVLEEKLPKIFSLIDAFIDGSFEATTHA